MAPWRYDPYLWVHLAGVATVPLWIDLCLLGLAVGNPTLPGLELSVIAGLGVLPVLVMQLRRPFYIYSLPGIALRPAALSDDQRRQLRQFRQWRVRLGALLVPVPLVWVLVKLYPLAFLARDITPFDDWGRFGGITIAVMSFCLANLFLQVPVAVLQVVATPDRHMAAVLPYPIEAIAADFSWLGLPVGKLLPSLAPQNLNPQAEQDVETGNEDLRLEHQDPELPGLDYQASTTLEPSGADDPTGTHTVADTHSAIAAVPTETFPADASDPELTAELSEGLILEQNHLLNAHPFYDRPTASHREAAGAEIPGEEAGEGVDDVQTDDYIGEDHRGHTDSALRHPEVDDLEETSSSTDLVSHPEPWPISADAYP